MEDREDALVMPEGWSRFVHVRRGGPGATPVEITAGAVTKAKEYVAKARPALDALNPDVGDRDLAERARRHLAGTPDPAGAAVVALLAAMGIGLKGARRRWRTFYDAPIEFGDGTARVDVLLDVLQTFADAWAAEHGPAFAACAAVELSSITIWRDPRHPEYDRGFGAARKSDGDAFHSDGRGTAPRIRRLLAGADDAEYEEAVERLAGYRDATRRRVLVSYLVPTRLDWVTECCRQHLAQYSPHEQDNPRVALFQSLGTAEHVRALGREAKLWWGEHTPDVTATLVDGLGQDALPMLVETLDDGTHMEITDRREVFQAIGMIPGDEAFRTLLGRPGDREAERALDQMMRRYPARAIRLLAEDAVTLRAAGETRAASRVTGLLKAHLQFFWDVAAVVEPGLPQASRAVIASVAPSGEMVPEAPLDALPQLLAQPPWTRPRKSTAKPVVIHGLKAAAEPRMVWDEGQHETWSVPVRPRWWTRLGDDTAWEALAAAYRAGRMRDDYDAPHLLASGPEEIVRPLLSEGWKGQDHWYSEAFPWVRSVAGRYQLDAVPFLLTVVRANPAAFAELLMPFLDERVAKVMAGWVTRAKKLRGTAVSWFDKHGADAARLLIPAALGKTGPARHEAEEGLLQVASRIGRDPVVAAAGEHGDEAAGAIAALLATDRLDRLPARIPKAPVWMDLARMPQVLLRGGAQALPLEAAGHLVTMAAISKPGEVYPGVDMVREACDPRSLAEFSWALFQEWVRSDAPSKDAWALHQLAWLGDDETARRLTPVIRTWPGEGGHHKAVAGLDVLAAIGTDVALLQLHGISEKARFKGLKARAQEKIGEVAAGLGLSAEQLSDRLVPDLGLDGDGSLTLDYGPRRFSVGFDEQLKPYVTDEDGKRRKALPKPGAKDDPERAAAAYKRFADLKKDVRLVAGSQVQRLERAMVTRRRWTPAEFRGLFVEHPLVWHIARRLVWLADGMAFRVAEDRSLADSEDEVFALPAEASIGIAHPLDLGENLAAWSQVFADYEILQPFPQLGRETHALTDDQRASGRLARFEGITVPAHTVLGLTRRGWERGNPEDNGVERWISKPIPGGLHVVIDLEWGISVGVGADQEDQPLNVVWISDRPQDFWESREARHTFGELDPVTASEVLSDLTWLAAAKL